MGIVNNSTELKSVIVEALKNAEFPVPTIDGDGNTGTEQIPLVTSDDAQKNVKFVDAAKPTFEEVYTTNKETGIEKIAEAISKEVLNYIIENAEVAMKARMDKLESDFNTLVSKFVTSFLPAVGVTPPGAVTVVEYNAMIVALQAALTSIGGAGREATTTIPLANEHEKVPSFFGDDVQIK